MNLNWCKDFCISAAVAMLAFNVEAATVTVTVQGVKANLGNSLYATLYCGASTWLDPAQAAGNAQVAVTAETLVFRFENVASGGCAMSLYHDENGNGTLDILKGPMPIPTEGLAVSNNAFRFGPPKYKEAEFFVKEPGVSLPVKMKY